MYNSIHIFNISGQFSKFWHMNDRYHTFMYRHTFVYTHNVFIHIWWICSQVCIFLHIYMCMFIYTHTYVHSYEFIIKIRSVNLVNSPKWFLVTFYNASPRPAPLYQATIDHSLITYVTIDEFVVSRILYKWNQIIYSF